ncbi:MAG: HAMP domain-containing histidine kinase [Spirochaetales bacterium]|nr:HAMP domain-containing histidine kinase [Spirochaetales bacterium]
MAGKKKDPNVFASNGDGTVTTELLNSLPITVAVLDENQRVVFGEERLMTLINQTGPPNGKRRPGDVLHCVNAASPEGCGTSEACRLCGAYQAIHESRSTNAPVTRECRIQYHAGRGYGAIDAKVTAAPYRDGERDYTLLTLQDLGVEKRRRVLERVFLHDLMNTAGGLTGLIQVLMEADDPETMPELLGEAERAGQQLLDEIIAQRQLMGAENNELPVALEDHDSLGILHLARDVIAPHNVAAGREIQIDPESERFMIHTDRVLLSRVLVNLVKNALEATHAPDPVTLGAGSAAGTAVFSVHNTGIMSEDVQLQMFQRSFSTKGEGRGVGTYSVRLLTENYLGGSVDFTSVEGTGTTFRVRLPIGGHA